MYSVADLRQAEGFPHSEISGSKPARGSPKLIATCYVLHRLSAPRHPPDALIALVHPITCAENKSPTQIINIQARHTNHIIKIAPDQNQLIKINQSKSKTTSMI